MRFWLRIGAWLAINACVVVAFAALLGNIGLVAGIALAIVATLWAWLWLPRSAHAAFEAGRYARATRRYRMLGVLSASRSRELAGLLSRIGCHVAAGELPAAEALLARVTGDELDAAERAVWLNNRACAALARDDAHGALALVDEATALRPDVAAVQHTRGMALLAVGRTDDAIAVLDGMRAGGELSPRLEAERCRELARAWTQKGEAAYAEDYRLRAEALIR